MRQNDPLRLLIISESWNEAEVLTNHLRNAGHIVRPLRVEDEVHLTAALRDQEWDLLLYLPDDLDLDIATVVALIGDSHKDLPIIVVSNNLSPQQHLEFSQLGVMDIVPSEPPGRLQGRVRREVESLYLRRALHACQDSLRETERRCRILLNNARDAIAYVQEGAHVLVNPAYLQIFGFSNAEEVIGVPILDMVLPSSHQHLKDLLRTAEHPDSNVQSLEIPALNTTGGQFPVRFEVTPTVLDGEACIQVVVHDLSPTTELQEQINDLSYRDFLTGLYNRQYFLQELDRTLHNHPGMIYLTIDNLAILRSKVGIIAIDQILKEVARRIIRHTEASDLVANFSDGVFTILAILGEESRLRNLATSIRKTLINELIEVAGVTVNITSSIGLHPAHLHITNIQTLLSGIETAVAAAQKDQINGIMTVHLDASSQKSNADENANFLRAALENNQLLILYQPIVYLRGDGREVYEVFTRLAGPNGGQPLPEQIMQTLDDAHLPAAMDRWTISQILDILYLRQTRNGKLIQILISVSLDTIMDETFPAWLGGKLKSLGISPHALILQAADTLVIDYYQRIKSFLPSLHGIGCDFALTHYRGSESILSQSNQFDIDYFKIDGELIQDLAINREHQSLVRTINEQIHAKGKYTLAESVQDANTLTLLWQYGIDYIQGEYLQKPSEVMNYDFSNLFLE